MLCVPRLLEHSGTLVFAVCPARDVPPSNRDQQSSRRLQLQSMLGKCLHVLARRADRLL